MVGLLSTTAVQIIGAVLALIGAVGALLWAGRRAGEDHAGVQAAEHDAVTQDAVLARYKAMAKAQAEAPRDPAGVMRRLDDGQF